MDLCLPFVKNVKKVKINPPYCVQVLYNYGKMVEWCVVCCTLSAVAGELFVRAAGWDYTWTGGKLYWTGQHRYIMTKMQSSRRVHFAYKLLACVSLCIQNRQIDT
jgi:hypothetical protein